MDCSVIKQCAMVIDLSEDFCHKIWRAWIWMEHRRFNDGMIMIIRIR